MLFTIGDRHADARDGIAGDNAFFQDALDAFSD